MSNQSCGVLIVGGGMVGLSLAHQLLERGLASAITVLEKEPEFGRHSSGRNSGVLHAGLYYKPGSVKAKVCVNGANRLRAWVQERGLPLNACGKLIVPPQPELDSQLNVLEERSRANAVQVQFWDEQQPQEVEFPCLPEYHTNHVLNAIFTAIFAPADLILDQALPTMNLP
jgi:L-2-hydroxyglutarate oxidase LhgO